jgi:DNA segregation ATPase FtsK/SpoIIIE-like protein
MTVHVDGNTQGEQVLLIDDLSDDKSPAVFGHNKLDVFVAQVRAQVIGEVPDLSTDKGRKRVASLAATVARSKTAVDGFGRAYLKRLKEMPKAIEAELREFTASMDALRDEVRKPLNDWEAEKAAKEQAQQQIIDQIIERYTLPQDATAEEIRGRLFALGEEPIPAEIGDRLEEAEFKVKHGITVLTEALAKRQQYEDEQAELERLRKEKAERDEQDRIAEAQRQAVEAERQRAAQEEQARRDAEAQRLAQAEQQAREAEQRAQQAEQDRIATEQRAEQERQQAEQRQQQAAEQARLQEQQRQQEEAAEQERQAQRRAADKAHRGAINKAALEALMLVTTEPDGIVTLGDTLSDETLKQIITAIVRGQIPNVTINY